MSVSLKDVYDIVNSMNEKLDRRLEKDEERLSKLENWQNRVFGIMGVIMLFATGFTTYIWDKVLGRSK